MIGSYSPNSIAGRPVRQIPSSKRRGTAASDVPPTMIGQPRAMPMPTRADNIAASRADGTFDAKRNTFNAANSGSYMNEQGIIGPRAPSPTGGVATPPAPAPAAPAPTSPPPPTAQIGKPRKPATFDGKSMADFKAQYASGKQVETPVTGMAPAFRAPNGEWKSSPQRIAGSRATSAAAPFPARPAPAIKETPMSGPGEPTLEKRASALGQAHAIINSPEAKKLMADIEAGKAKRATQQPTMVSSKSPAAAPTNQPPMRTTSAPSGAAFGIARSRPMPATASKTPNPPPSAIAKPSVTPPRLSAAQAQAIKNPQGLSARMNPPGAKPVAFLDDPIVKPVASVVRSVSGAIDKQAAKNPRGLAAKINSLFGKRPAPSTYARN